MKYIRVGTSDALKKYLLPLNFSLGSRHRVHGVLQDEFPNAHEVAAEIGIPVYRPHVAQELVVLVELLQILEQCLHIVGVEGELVHGEELAG